MNHVEYAQTLRDCHDRHYNCCQSVLLPFAVDSGADLETVCHLADHFGAGMRRGAACGAVTGGLMALGLLGHGDDETARAFQREFAARAGELDCADLLRSSVQHGVPRKAHCDGLVALAVTLADGFLEKDSVESPLAK